MEETAVRARTGRSVSRTWSAISVLAGTMGLGVAVLAQQLASGPVTEQELRDGLPVDGSRWITFGGNYANHRHSPLTQITPQNVAQLVPQWTFQTNLLGRFETTPLIRDNVLYVTGPLNVAWAIDARTGREIWRYRRELPETTALTACCGLVNKGFGMLGERLFMTTLDAHLLALDVKTGSIIWDVVLEDYRKGYASTITPLITKDKVIVGIAGGEYGIRGFIDAYDTQTGKLAWRFYTIPGSGEPGNETWAGDSWQRGGASVWTTGAYDPELNLVYIGTGNPGPDYHSDSRKGDNLYSDSEVALDADTGQLKWYYQFTPHDLHDWDATQVPILADITIGDRQRQVLMTANRNGFFYTLDRATGELLVGKPYVQTTWAKEIARDGRPILLPGNSPDEKGALTCPDIMGGTNFWPPAYDPSTTTFFVNAREVCATYYAWEPEYVQGTRFTGGAAQRAQDMPAIGALRALDPTTGGRKWQFEYPTPATAGLLTTASGLIFSGDAEGNFLALDSKSGKLLWRHQMGSALHGTSAVTYMLDGRQQVLVPAGTTLTAWALPDITRMPATRE